MAWFHPCEHCGDLDHSCQRVKCARCGVEGLDKDFVIEEGDEWECPPCNERENARERCKATVDMFGNGES